MAPHSVLPPFYWIVFGWYEPLLTVGSCIGAFLNPKALHDQQAPWPAHSPPPDDIPRATLVTILQLAHVVGLCGLINWFVLSAARKYLAPHLALQEKIVGALLTPLLIADFLHMGITFWALGDMRWDFPRWSAVLWVTFITGLSLMLPRIGWHLGVGRYVEKRDGHLAHANKL